MAASKCFSNGLSVEVSAESTPCSPKKAVVVDVSLKELQALPDFDFDHRSRNTTLVAFLATIVVSVASLGVAIGGFVHAGRWETDSDIVNHSPIFQSTAAREVTTLVFNLVVTAATETLGFIHGTSLRWALYREGRLEYNSNLRIFTSAKRCAANGWIANCAWGLAITLSYSSASQVFLPEGTSGAQVGEESAPRYVLNTPALGLLGASLLLQVLLASWCLFAARPGKILSWNCSPLNTTLANLRRGYVGCPTRAAGLAKPRQLAARHSIKHVRVIIACLWCLPPLVLTWSIAVYLVSKKRNGAADLSFQPEDDADGVYPSSATTVNDNYNTLYGLAVITAMQLIYTLALHAAEQVINLHRDEKIWRRANDLSCTSTGAKINPGSLQTAFMTWPSCGLLVLKPVSHWLFGLSVGVFAYGYLTFRTSPTLCLAGLSVVLCVLVTIAGFASPPGPQPTTWGSLHKLVNYVDDWGSGSGGNLFWGAKHSADGVGTRSVGTSGAKDSLEEVKVDGAPYLGLGDVSL